MNDRFTKEYIEFVTKCEAIQKLWRETRGVFAGDWFYDPEEAEVHIVDEMGEYMVIIALGADYYWLPTLNDLMEELDRAGPDHSFQIGAWMSVAREFTSDGVKVAERPIRLYGGWSRESRCDAHGDSSGFEMAAARLLKCVLERTHEQSQDRA